MHYATYELKYSQRSDRSPMFSKRTLCIAKGFRSLFGSKTYIVSNHSIMCKNKIYRVSQINRVATKIFNNRNTHSIH